MTKTSINFKPCKVKLSEAHNERRVSLDYVFPEHSDKNTSWKSESISSRFVKIKELYEEQVGQEMQDTANPIREAVVVIKEETQINHLMHLGAKIQEEFGPELFQIHIHRDEGHLDDQNNFVPNLHAHLLFDWQDKRQGLRRKKWVKRRGEKMEVDVSTYGRSFRLGKIDMSKIQTLTAEVLGMERGVENSKATRLEAKEFKVFAERKRKLVQEVASLEEQKKSLSGFIQKSNQVTETVMKKYPLLRTMWELDWSECDFSKIDQWLSNKVGEQLSLRNGNDKTEYFVSLRTGHTVARMKDLPSEVRESRQEALQIKQDQNQIKRKRLRPKL